MKNMLMFVVAVVMFVTFVPRTFCGETAQLNLFVTFAHDPDLERVLELHNQVGQLQEDAMEIFDNARNSHDPYVVEGAILQLKRFKDEVLNDIKDELNEILGRRPDLAAYINPTLRQIDLDQNHIQEYIDILEEMLPNISVALEGPNPWQIEQAGLDQVYSNDNAHRVVNDGNVRIRVDIGYGILADVLPGPGASPGENRYATWVNHQPFDPVFSRIVIADLDPGKIQDFLIEFGTPTSLTVPVTELSTGYEIRAYRDPVPTE